MGSSSQLMTSLSMFLCRTNEWALVRDPAKIEISEVDGPRDVRLVIYTPGYTGGIVRLRAFSDGTI